MSVADLCNRDVACTTRAATVADAAQLMPRYHIGDAVIVDRSEAGRYPSASCPIATSSAWGLARRAEHLES
jgi:CBS domain-containing protein